MKKWERIAAVIWCLLVPAVVAAVSQIVSSLPFTLTNGTVADATQVMADFNQIVNNVNANAAKNGVNADITALSALVTPLTAAQGGTTLFIGGTSTGSANAQVVASPVPTGLALANKPSLYFNPGFTNTGAVTLNANSTGATNVFRPSFSGPVALTGGEIQLNQLAQVTYDGTRWVLTVDTPQFGVSTDIASGATTDLGTISSHVARITGVVGITAFGSTASIDFPIYMLRFAGALTLTHNATSLILPSAANITTAANDAAIAQYLGGGNWQVVSYIKANGLAVIPSVVDVQVFTATGANTWNRAAGVTNVQVIICGAGGGGGGGSRSAGSAVGTGGGGGGGGYCAHQSFKAADAGASQTVTIGTGGPGGAGATVNGNAGSAGTAGGNSTFGTLLTGFGGGQGSSSAGAGGGGGAGGGLQAVGPTASGATGGASELKLGSSNYAQCDGATANTTPLQLSITCPASAGGGGGSGTSGANPSGLGASGGGPLSQGPGGGGGGGHTAANVGVAGGAGGRSLGCATAPTGGAAGANNGGSTAADFNYHSGCGGGGGGGANGTGTSGGNGGAGTSAGGGGGGGSGDNANAGSGGGGGNGLALVVSW